MSGDHNLATLSEKVRAIVIGKRASLLEAVKVIDEHPRYGMAVVLDDEGRLHSILTIGDLYRAIFSGVPLEAEVGEFSNRSPVTLAVDDLRDIHKVRAKTTRLFERKGLSFPIVDAQMRLVDVVHYAHLEEQLSGIVSSTSARQRVLVIGGGGYLGTSLTETLLKRGFLVRVLDNFAHKNFALYNLPSQDNLEIIKDDIRDIRPIVGALEDVNAVVLLAAVVGDPAGRNNPRQTIEINYLASKMIAEAAKYAHVSRFVFASTCSVYGAGTGVLTETAPLRPASHYAKTKIAAEEAISSLGNESFCPTILRFGTLFGLSPRMRFDLVVNIFSLNAIRNGAIEIYGGKQWRPLLHVRDAANAIVKVIESQKSNVANQIFNVGSETQNIRIAALGELVKQVSPSVEVIVRVGEDDSRDYRVSFEKIQSCLGFESRITIKEGIEEIIQFAGSKPDEDFSSEKYSNNSIEY